MSIVLPVLFFLVIVVFMLMRSKNQPKTEPNVEWENFARQTGGAYQHSGVGWEDRVQWAENGWPFSLNRISALNANSNSLASIYTTKLEVPLQFSKPCELHIQPRQRAPELVLAQAQGQPMTTGDAALDAAFEVRASDAATARALLLLPASRQMLAAWPKLELDIGARRNLVGQADGAGAGQLVMQMEYDMGKAADMQQWRLAALEWAQALRQAGFVK